MHLNNQNFQSSNLNYISIIREPSKWVTSLLNYWETLDFLNFDFINELFWKKKVGVNLINFNNRSESEKIKIKNTLIEFYLNFTEDSFKLKNIRHVQIYDLENFMENELSNEINEKIIRYNLNKRENVKKKKKYLDEKADQKYKQILLKHD